MRSPPPITNFIAYPVTAGIGLLAIAVTGLDLLGGRSIAALTMGVDAFGGEPWRLVTSVLPHGGALHLLFNVYWLWVLGTLVEEVFGHARMLLLLVLFAAGSAAAEFAIFEGGIGLSGVVYGLVGLSYVLSRNDRRFADAMDARTAQLFVLWFFFCIGATVAGLLRIANVAHGVGAVLGGLAGLAIAGRPSQRVAWIGAIAGVIALSFACATVLRPTVNLSNRGGLVGLVGDAGPSPIERAPKSRAPGPQICVGSPPDGSPTLLVHCAPRPPDCGDRVLRRSP